jgi:hypothetical protein
MMRMKMRMTVQTADKDPPPFVKEYQCMFIYKGIRSREREEQASPGLPLLESGVLVFHVFAVPGIVKVD